MSRLARLLAVVLGAGLAVPSALAEAGLLEVSRLEIEDGLVAGPAQALRSDASAGGASASLALAAADLRVDVDSAEATVLGPALPIPSGTRSERHEYGAATLSGATVPEAQELLLAPLDGQPLRVTVTASRLAAQPAPDGSLRMEHSAPGGRPNLEVPVAGATEWAAQDGTLVVEGSFQVSFWSWDLVARGADGRTGTYSAGTREGNWSAAPAVPQAAARDHRQEQVVVQARDARLEVELRGLPVSAYLAGASATWTGGARFATGPDLSAAEGWTRHDGPGRLEAGPARGGHIPVRIASGGDGGLAGSAVAALDAPGGVAGLAFLLSIPLLALAVLVPGAGLPWLRKRHEYLMAEAEQDLESGRYHAALARARRLLRSRWFAVDAAAVGAEAALRLGDSALALSLLDGGRWRGAAAPLRDLLRARAYVQGGDRASALRLLHACLAAAPDLEGQARRDRGLRALLDGPAAREGYA